MRPTILVAALLATSLPLGAQAPRQIMLDTPTATSSRPFGMITRVRELSDGSLLIADPIDKVLRRVSGDLKSVTTLGREGSGPGEYRQPEAVWPLPGDSTLLIDLGNNRLVKLGPAGGFGNTTPIMTQGASGRMVMLNVGGVDARGRVYSRGLPSGDSIAIERTDRDGGGATVVANVKGPTMNREQSGSAGNRSERSSPVPLSPADGWAVSQSGLLYLVRASDYHLDVVLPNGEAHHGTPVSYRPIPITDEEMDAYRETMRRRGGINVSVENNNGQVQFSLQRAPLPEQELTVTNWPDAKPAFDPSDLHVDAIERLWVRRYTRHGEPARYDIFTPNGDRVATVELKPMRKVVGMGRQSVYVARRDHDDLQYLERYRLVK